MFFALLLVISGCAGTSATREPSYSAGKLQEVGEKYISAGDTANALKYLTEAEQKKPNDPVIQYDLGLAYDQRGMPDKALSHFQNALKMNPSYPEALNAIGSVYAKRGQVELARQSFQKAMDDPFYRTPQIPAYNLGRLHERKGEVEIALTYYQKAVKFDPQFGMAWFRMGQILEQSGRADDARHAYGNAVEASPDLAEAHLRYGIMSYQAGDVNAALSSLNRVGRLVPNTDMADEARVYLEKLSVAPQPKALTHATPHTPPGDIEFISNDDLQHRQTKEAPPSPPAPQLAPPLIQGEPAGPQAAPVQREIPNETQSPPAKEAPVSADVAAPARGGVTEGAGPQSSKYVVQIGSFLDREKAEEIKKSLDGKGYRASVKPLNHRRLGKVFVIQLQPESSVSRATTLATQLRGEIEGEPVILKVPAHPQAERTNTPAKRRRAPRPGKSDNRANPGHDSSLYTPRSTRTGSGADSPEPGEHRPGAL